MRIVIADEWAVLRGGVAGVVASCDLVLAHQGGAVTEALAQLGTGGPEVVLFGLVSDHSQAAAVRRAKAIDPDVHTVVLVPDPDREGVLAVLDAGADAVLDRAASEHELRDALHHVVHGDRYVAPALLATVFGDVVAAEPERDEHPLTDRERRVLSLLVDGRSNRQIACELLIGEATVKTHLHNVYEKLSVSNRVQAVSRAMELDLLP